MGHIKLVDLILYDVPVNLHEKQIKLHALCKTNSMSLHEVLACAWTIMKEELMEPIVAITQGIRNRLKSLPSADQCNLLQV